MPPPELEIWMRAGDAPDEPTTQQALLAHATDLTLIGTTLRNLARSAAESDAAEKLRAALLEVEAPPDQLDRLGLA